MTLKNRSGSARRLRVVALSTSLGLLGTAATAQDINIGDAIRGGIDAQVESGQRGNLNPTERGIGEAVRGVLQGDAAGDALRRGVGEAARSATETPEQTLRRDQWQAGEGRFRYDAQGRQMFDAQGRPLYDTRVPQYDNRVPQYENRYPQSGTAGVGFDSQSRARARLGISMAPAEQGIRVQQVMQGTAAADAGLRPGDVILSVDGQQISDPNQVSTLIRQRQPGDQLDLVVLRDGQEQTLNATLTGYDVGDRQRMARPILDADGQDLRQQIQQLQQEVRSLRNELNQLKNTQRPEGADADAAATLESDLDAARTRTESDLNLDADADAQVPSAPNNRDGAELDLDADASLDADAGAAGRAGADAGAAGRAGADAGAAGRAGADAGAAGRAGAGATGGAGAGATGGAGAAGGAGAGAAGGAGTGG